MRRWWGKENRRRTQKEIEKGDEGGDEGGVERGDEGGVEGGDGERKRNEKGKEMVVGLHRISHAPLRELESARYGLGFTELQRQQVKQSWPGDTGPFFPSRESFL